MHALLLAYDLHTRLFMNVTEGISDEDAQNRLDTRANHIAWITGSIVFQRYDLANLLHIPLVQKSHRLFSGHSGILDGIRYPPMSEFRNDWKTISPVLRGALAGISADALESTEEFQLPGEKLTLFDAMAFIIDRESYCIGQIGLFRRLLGYEAMKYQ